MAAKATPVPFNTGTKNHGDFRCKKFNIFNDVDMQEYADLRTRANDASAGIQIEQIREYSRKETIREGAGESLSVTTIEDIYLVVHYWEKKPKRTKGDSDEEVEPKKVWSSERKVG